ncbi:type II secretion system protein [Psychrobacillus sp. INOP01]|uniref:PulJ/GspJ family protein n=1 Tax=Psychrobacillus sp. INOP01 TaxID=2829187 RepID=UPI001BADFF09|nr:type II secretion system protein [Psychrobacillus sp. INOP01]QUG42245.1 type II secretion system protein [Psychrobacillus sp. INOP01]
MKKRLDQQGFTLIELLAALVLFTIFGSVIWGLFFQSLKYNDAEVSKNQLQQETNLILSTIQQMHTSSTITSIESTGSTLLIISDKGEFPFNKDNVLYQINEPINLPNKEFHLVLTLSSTENSSIQLETETTFSKLK